MNHVTKTHHVGKKSYDALQQEQERTRARLADAVARQVDLTGLKTLSGLIIERFDKKHFNSDSQ